MFEVEECEGWTGHYQQWCVTDGTKDYYFSWHDQADIFCEYINEMESRGEKVERPI
jgi:hypothetical protein